MYWEKDGYILRPARAEDADTYYEQNYCPPDRETARMTGCREKFTKEEVLAFFRQSLADDERVFFLILSPDGRIIGESVINEIDRELWSANFRIALLHPGQRGRRIDFWAVEVTRDYAFRELKLHRLSPDVLSFNPRAQKFCKKAGFRVEGVLRDSVMDGDVYGDDILMALLEDEWRARTGMNLTAGLRTPAARISRL